MYVLCAIVVCSFVFLGINNDFIMTRQLHNVKLLPNKTFHELKFLMLSRPDPLPFTEGVWLRQTTAVYETWCMYVELFNRVIFSISLLWKASDTSSCPFFV